MNKSRMEAFSDGVIAIIITIMVLEIHVPDAGDPDSLYSLLITLFGYVLSFIYVGIYWVNHHHLIHAVRKVSPAIMWSNLNLLFWLSLVPFGTSWMGKSKLDTYSVVTYAIILVCCGISYDILRRYIIQSFDQDNTLKKAVQNQMVKTTISSVIYLVAIPLAFLHVYISLALFIFVAILWLIPSKEIEKGLSG